MNQNSSLSLSLSLPFTSPFWVGGKRGGRKERKGVESLQSFPPAEERKALFALSLPSPHLLPPPPQPTPREINSCFSSPPGREKERRKVDFGDDTAPPFPPPHSTPELFFLPFIADLPKPLSKKRGSRDSPLPSSCNVLPSDSRGLKTFTLFPSLFPRSPPAQKSDRALFLF